MGRGSSLPACCVELAYPSLALDAEEKQIRHYYSFDYSDVIVQD